MKKWSLYRHVSPSGKVYIGITSRKPQERWGNNGCHYRGQIFLNAIMKYGWDNIKHEVLFTDLSEERAKHLEIELIRHYKNLGQSYNMTDGGDGTVGFYPSEEVRKKMSEAQKKLDNSKRREILNKNRTSIGLKHRKAVVQFSQKGRYIRTFKGGKFAFAATGVDPSTIAACCKGKHFKAGNYLWMYLTDYLKYQEDGVLEQILSSMSKKAQFIPGKYKRTDVWRRKKSESQKGIDKRDLYTKQFMKQRSIETKSKPVMQMSLDNEFIDVFPSGSYIQKRLGYKGGYIGTCCNGKRKEAYGFKWKYISKEEYEKYKTDN